MRTLALFQIASTGLTLAAGFLYAQSWKHKKSRKTLTGRPEERARLRLEPLSKLPSLPRGLLGTSPPPPRAPWGDFSP